MPSSELRVEAEEAAVRARRGRRAELDRWQRRAEEAQAAAQYAQEQRDALAVRLATVNESCERLRQGVVALQGVAAELRTTFELEHRASQGRIRELEGELERARAHPPAEQRSEAEEAQRREEMAGALAAAVARLRTRAAVAAGQPQAGEGLPAGAPPPGERPAAGALPPVESVGEIVRAGIPAASPGDGLAPGAPVGSASEPPAEVPAAPASEQPPAEVPAAPASEQPPAEVPAAPATAGVPRTEPGPPEVPTVIVVPRLFPARGRSARRLAPAVRRVAVRLARWADRAQDRPR